MPGTEKIRSITTEPASIAGKTLTNMVMRGSRLLRKTWRKMTARAGTPFARAVRT